MSSTTVVRVSYFSAVNERKVIFSYYDLQIHSCQSTAKRQQRAQDFTSSISHANFPQNWSRRFKGLLVERLERNRRWFADRDEREEKERGREAHENEKVASPPSTNNNISFTQNLIAKV